MLNLEAKIRFFVRFEELKIKFKKKNKNGIFFFWVTGPGQKGGFLREREREGENVDSHQLRLPDWK